jgi:hypothetical protein
MSACVCGIPRGTVFSVGRGVRTPGPVVGVDVRLGQLNEFVCAAYGLFCGLVEHPTGRLLRYVFRFVRYRCNNAEPMLGLVLSELPRFFYTCRPLVGCSPDLMQHRVIAVVIVASGQEEGADREAHRAGCALVVASNLRESSRSELSLGYSSPGFEGPMGCSPAPPALAPD